MNRDEICEYLMSILTGMVTVPAELGCTATVDDLGTLITLKLAREDYGKVIGKGGETIKALRLIMKTVGYLHNIHVSIKIPD